MKLAVVSHKETWCSKGRYVTTGGFPFQVEAMSELFDETLLLTGLRRGTPPPGARELEGHNLTTRPLPEPAGLGWRRKLSFLGWLFRFGPRLWRELKTADAVHALVPGDLGFLGILFALWQRKKLLVRHCGTWGTRNTAMDRFLTWFLPRIAGGKVIVLATGGGAMPPEPSNTAVRWIFSTALKADDLQRLHREPEWSPSRPPRLVTVARLTARKNVRAVIDAMPLIRATYPGARLDIVGDGDARSDLEALATELALDDVAFHGNVRHEEVLRILRESDLFVFPTLLSEGFPKVSLEAMACALPLVVTPVSVLTTLVEEGAGVLVSAPTGRGVADACLSLLGDFDAFRKAAARSVALARQFSLERWTDDIRTQLEPAWGPLRSDSH